MLNRLQVIRAWAAIGVVLFHLGGAVAAPKYSGTPLFAHLTGFGTHGVLLFFVLSGFIIHHVHAADLGQPARLRRYLFRRFFRVYPVYWLILVLVAGFALGAGIGLESMPTDPAAILRTILLAPQDKAVVGGTGAPVLIVAWSLQYEVLFYFAFALCIVNLRFGLCVIALFFAVLLWLQASGTTQAIFPAFMQPTHFMLFGAGILTSWDLSRPVSEQGARWISRGTLGLVGLAWLAEGTGAILSNGAFHLFASQSGVVILGVLSMLLIGSFARLDQHRSRPISPVMSYLGDCSYIIYLVHFPVISAACKIALRLGLTGYAGAGMAAGIALTGTLVLSILIRELFEKPVLAFARRRAALPVAGRTP